MPRSHPTSDESDLAALAGRVLVKVQDALPSGDDARVLFSRGVEHLHLKLSAGGASLELTLSGSASFAGSDPFSVLDSQRLAPIALPGLDTDEGVLAHMMVAESKNPYYADYDEAVAKLGFRAMKAVVVNRLKNNPKDFGAPGATTWTDIIVAPGQWDGFSRKDGKVQLTTKVADLIKKVLDAANTGAPGKFTAFVQSVLDAVAAPVDDPFKGITSIGGVPVLSGGFGWRTKGSTSPGPRFVAIPADKGGLIANNQFYTVKR